MELLVLFGVLFAMLVIGVPVAFSLLAAALACFLAMDIPPIVAVQRVAAGISVFTLMAIPFFIFAGDLMYRAGIADRLVRVADAAIGRVRGGLGGQGLRGKHRRLRVQSLPEWRLLPGSRR